MSNEALPGVYGVGFIASSRWHVNKAVAAILADKRLLPNAKLAAIALAMHGGRLSREEIANRIDSHNRTMTRIMGRLVDLGLVDEARDGMTSAKSYRWKGATT